MASSSSNSTSAATGSSSSTDVSPAAKTQTHTLFSSSSQTSSIKLDRENYLVWESVVRPLIKGNRLDSHINGLGITPPRMITSDTGVIPNPAFVEWEEIDHLLLFWLRNTMTLEVAAQLLHCTTAYALWTEARNLTCASMKSRIMVLKGDLNKIKKGSMKMRDYLNKLKSLSDQLSLAGAPVSTEDLIMHTLNGLDSDYNPAVFTLNRQANLTWIEVQAELLSFESRIEQLNQQFTNLSVQPSVNFAQRDANAGFFNSGSPNQFGQGFWRGGSSNGHNGSRGRGRGTRGGRRGGSGSSRPYCALCERPGHAVHNCFHRFDKNFQPPTHGRTLGGSRNQFSQPPHAFFANSADNYSANPQAVCDPTWYMDSGANYHITPNPEQLENYTQVGQEDRGASLGRDSTPRNVSSG